MMMRRIILFVAALFIAIPGAARSAERVVAAYDGYAGFQGPI